MDIMWLPKSALKQKDFEEKIANLIEELKTRLFDITQENFRNPNCIDGRDIDAARPSIPGWGLGALGVILAYFDTIDSDINKSKVVQLIKEYFGGTLTGHTDTHEHDKNWHNCQWCGHAQRIINEWSRYNLSSESSDMLESEAREIKDKDLDTLKWSHKERNVFIVDIPGKWIIANGKHGQDFVYNVWYAHELYTEISQILEKELWIEISIEEVLEIAEGHFMTTGWDLAAGKDVFAVTNIDSDGNPEIEYLMTVDKAA